MNGAVDAAASQQRGVGGVHDRVNVLGGDITVLEDDTRLAEHHRGASIS